MFRPSRRTLLASIGGLVLSGCLSRGSRGELPVEGTFPNGYPEYDDVERVVAYGEIDPDTTPIYLEPSTTTLTENEGATFTLTNAAGRTFALNPYGWRLHKRVDDRWYHVAPWEVPLPLTNLRAGDSHVWTLRVDNAALEPGGSPDRGGGQEPNPIAGLGGGEYAFGTRGWFEDESHEDAIGFSARFDLETEPLELTPSDAISETKWDDETLVAMSDRGDADSDSTRLGAYELVRTDDDVRGDPHITETLMRNDQLRDVVALAREYDADRVRLKEYDGTHPIFGSRDDGYYEYDGETYEISTRELEGDETDE
ncbi:hypothetical protein D8Y22_05255 [Salinadaptatus halalkaliphilus]|uniref:Uncharacterized protein n=1 Tax=Salinadaptatus halalkaliphilus TaxID=2419781 RepID=A0A4S3TNP0_9EURY|nr:hypothetical protein [Salinadaptatus halalkaliphilus]THE65929.1 hypothetical protein D8Y22_05255 [Salinadaptatus halalkaliphilus]